MLNDLNDLISYIITSCCSIKWLCHQKSTSLLSYLLTFIPIAQKVFELYCMFPMKNNASSYLFVYKVLFFKGYVKMNHCVTKQTFAPSEDTDQPGHPSSDQRLRRAQCLNCRVCHAVAQIFIVILQTIICKS